MSEKREGFGLMELLTVSIVTIIPLWLHFESKSWTGVSEAPTMFLYIFMVGLLICTYIALSMYVVYRLGRPRYERNDFSPNNWRDDLL